MGLHLLTEVDVDSRRAVCAECGPVNVHQNGSYKGTQYWICGSASRARAKKAWDRYASSGLAENARLLRKYGITCDQYEQMLRDQNGLCARCERPAAEMKIRLSVDHCHKTGVVRKLLCANCNTYLGRLEMYRDRLAQDLLYLDTGSFEPVPIAN